MMPPCVISSMDQLGCYQASESADANPDLHARRFAPHQSAPQKCRESLPLNLSQTKLPITYVGRNRGTRSQTPWLHSIAGENAIGVRVRERESSLRSVPVANTEE